MNNIGFHKTSVHIQEFHKQCNGSYIQEILSSAWATKTTPSTVVKHLNFYTIIFQFEYHLNQQINGAVIGSTNGTGF